ncbi:mediator of RNA polymerase II transcription subunit 9 [Bacillus rossius redtenbacheri]|uniref:mediator of RNA polymerase II transcription subunit 9 n=1 Tax=Bacillus rossius redtenbacheri TaxID=93214 RepID=UPI002FDEF253
METKNAADTCDNEMEGCEQNNTTHISELTVKDVDVDFLPLIYDIIRGVEKDPQDTTQKSRDSQDTSQKVLELNKKLDQARNQIRRLPGIEFSKEEQLKRLETLRKQLQLKKDLLLKYRHVCSFDIPK